jgi:type II secretory pathway component PulJ
MIAVMLLAMLGAGLVATLNSTITVKEKVDVISNRFHLARQAMERMVNEISMAYISGQKNTTLPVSETKFKGAKDKISFDAFGHMPHLKNSKESDQREVSYYLDEDERSGKQSLMRKIHNNITLRLGEEGRVDTLCPDVKSLEFKYWDSRDELWKSSWEIEGVEAQRTLPSRIQIEMEVVIEGDVIEKLITETEIWLTKPINIIK